ncbi:ATP-binding cassette domain-containing protein [Erysipelothrix sp. HDW6A]|uniref:methionine ABC transporter ATP-binding protein n=1 Tax=Erysipelothrix sp. HDW6A TaxID=2714928 RepID=UPI0014092C93|nr:ATP-binding cassette domain-containing protein [Erysipelothrix sp. HDW6A]QIK57427.1 ATP-binding cassette domain-containing protein [Erysipelothrix sp. HDW6A]
MIEFRNVSKTFVTESNTVHAVRDVSFTIQDKEIFGVIGFSGAGKSTLVRCINMLERPTSGDVLIKDVVINELSPKELRNQRKKIGMIFQGFNLLESRTIFDNVAFPLKDEKLPKNKLKEKVGGLLELVGISDKADAYPSQLSGGQKQRVAIARALANDPDILLCDEATSALDPQTTKTILKLLKEVNVRLGVTIVIITHEMAVIKEICDRVAVMEDGYVKELNTVVNIFSNPEASITKDFVNNTTNLESLNEIVEKKPEILQIQEDQQLIKLSFHGSNTKEAQISEISSKFDVSASIIFANVEIIQDEIIGTLVVILTGDRKVEAIQYLEAQGTNVEVIENVRSIN